TPGLAHERQKKAVEVCRDVFAGTLHMRTRAGKYLPMFPKEKPEDYDRRLNEAVLFNGFRRTIKGLVGLVFSKEPALGDDVPPPIKAHMKDVDLEGRDITEFGMDHFEDAMIDGHAGIFVDFQEVDTGALKSLAEEKAAGLRPYWIPLRKQQILKFSTARIAGRRMLSLLRWIETSEEDDGRWGEKSVERVREYRLAVLRNENTGERRLGVQWSLYELQKTTAGKDVWALAKSGNLGIMDEIPLAVTYTNRTGYLESEPPLLDLGLENIKHWQKRSDKDNVEHVACVPIFVTKGVSEKDLKGFSIGPTVGLNLEGKATEVDAAYVEIQGAGLEASRESLKDVEHRMAILGLSMLMSETRQAETATSKRIDKSESDAQLVSMGRGLGLGLWEALRFTAKWEGLERGGTITVNRDFERKLLDSQMVQALLAAVDRGKLSMETFWDALRRGEVLTEGFDPKLEKARIEAEGSGEADEKIIAALKQLRAQRLGAGEDEEDDDAAA
ncbi:MAG TPA: DUF4055 domain-containing protein, partial [Desulfobacterales bacterium]|nr:DUF4055 domain-containing protein [Desulfobacterales bacterium]